MCCLYDNIKNDMAKFIDTHAGEESKSNTFFLDLEKIVFVDFKKYVVYTVESKPTPNSTNNKYEFTKDSLAWKAIMQYVEENMYEGQKKESEL